MPPRLARLLAAVVAIALVAGAFAVRGALSDDEGAAGSGSDAGGSRDGDGNGREGGGAFRVLCDEDLGEACSALADLPSVAEIEVLPWSEVRSGYAEEAPPFDAWLTLDPLPAVLDYTRDLVGQPPATSGEPVTVASASLALLARGEVGCDGAWPCTLDLAEDEAVGVPQGSTAAGAVVRAAAFAALVPAEQGIGGLDDDDNRARLDALVDSADPLPLDPQRDAFLTQPGRYRAVVTTHGLADDALRGPRGSGLTAAAVEPGATIGVVLVGLGAEAGDAVAALREGVSEQTVRDALTEAGWDGDPARSSGLPEFDVIYAIQEELGR